MEGGGFIWSSDDWRKFDISNMELAFNIIPKYYENYNSNNVKKIYGNKPKFERPKVLMIDGSPSYFFAPSGWNIEGGNRTVCYILKIRK